MTWSRRALGLGVLAAALVLAALLGSCQLNDEKDSGEILHAFSLDRLADSLAGFDSVLITVQADSAGAPLDTLLRGPLTSPDELRNLPAPDIHGGIAVFTILGYDAGKTVYHLEKRFDIAEGKTLATRKFLAPAAAVSFAQDQIQIEASDSALLPEISVTPPDLDFDLVWTAEAGAIIALDSTHVRGLRPGTSELWASLSAYPEIQDMILVTVIAKTSRTEVGRLDLAPDTLEVALGPVPRRFNLSFSPSEAQVDVTWRSFDTTIAVVTRTGEILGVKEGKTQVEILSRGLNPVADTAWVHVFTPVPVESVRLEEDSLELYVGGVAETVVVRVEPPKAKQELDWNLANPSLAEFSRGKAKGLKPGRTKLYAASRDSPGIRDSLEIIVLPSLKVEVLTVAPDSLVLYTGGPGGRLDAAVVPSEARTALRWRSGSPAVVRTDDSGRVVPVSPGRTHVRVLCLADSTARDSALIVVRRDMPDVDVGGDTSLPVGGTLSLRPAVRQEHGSVALFAWDMDGNGDWDGTSDSVAEVSRKYEIDGVFTARFRFVDSEGNDTTVSKKIRVVKGPVVLILSPKDGTYTNKSEIDVNWSVDGKLQTAFTRQTLEEGPNHVSRSATDEEGDFTEIAITVYLDQVPPEKPGVQASTPTNDRTPTWTWKGGGGGNGQFRYRLDAEIQADASVLRDSSHTVILPLDEGEHFLLVQERDEAGNWSESGHASVRIDLTPPQKPFLSVAPPSPMRIRNPKWTWLSGNGDGSGVFRYRQDSSAWTEIRSGRTGGTVETPDLSPGAHRFEMQEKDSAGNWSESAVLDIEIDETGPEAPKVSAASGTPTNQRQPAWSWVANGGGGAGIFRWRLDDTAWSLAAEDTARSFRAPSPLGEGSHVLQVQERDSAGNWSASGLAVIRIDLTPPPAPSVTSASARTTQVRPTWTWTSDGGGGSGRFRHSLDAPPADGTVETGALAFTPSAALSEGNHALYVQERDSAGNWSASGSFALRIHGQTGYAVGSGGTILKTRDGGASWSQPVGKDITGFRSPFFTDARTGYGIQAGKLIKTTDAGSTWFTVNTGVTASLTSVFFLNQSVGFATGQGGMLLRTLDAGASWSTLPSGTGQTLHAIHVLDNNSGYAVGDSGTILYTANGGSSWTRQTSGVTTSLTYVRSFLYSAVYAFGSGNVLRSTYGGGTWSILTNAPSLAHRVVFTGPLTGFLLVNTYVLKTTDGGTTWVNADFVIGAHYITGFHFLENGTGFAVGDSEYGGAVIYRTENNGTTWTYLGNGGVNYLYAVNFVDSRTGFASNSDGDLIRTDDGGDSWNWLGGGNLVSVSFPDASTGYIARFTSSVTNGSGRVLKTLDGGATWHAHSGGIQPRSENGPLQSLHFPTAQSGHAVGYSLQSTQDGAASWTSHSTDNFLAAVYFPTLDRGCAVGEGGSILVTRDRGRTWTRAASGTANDLKAVHFPTPAIGYAVGIAGTILKSLDSGSTWAPVPSGIISNLSAVFFTKAEEGYAAGAGGTLLKTTNAGATWAPLPSGTSNNLNAIVFTDTDKGYAAGGNGIILRTLDGGSSWTPAPSGTSALLNSIAFP